MNGDNSINKDKKEKRESTLLWISSVSMCLAVCCAIIGLVCVLASFCPELILFSVIGFGLFFTIALFVYDATKKSKEGNPFDSMGGYF